MHETKPTLTLTDLTTIFHVTKSPLRSHLKKNHLDKQLMKNGHMVKRGRKGKKLKRYYFDEYALAKIALTFKGKIPNRKSKSSSDGISKTTSNNLFRDISKINKKLDMIINKLNIHY